jgi:F-type H+-transporting ATPase subunit b
MATAQAQTQTKATTETHGGPKAPFPPFNSETYASQIVWLVIAFIALYALLSRVALPRIASIFAARSGKVKSDLATAGRLAAESQSAIEAYEKALADARAKAQAIASATRAEFAAKSEQKKKGLEAGLAKKLAEAERQIEATKKAAMANVRGIAADAAAEIVRRLLGTAPAKQNLDRALDAALH